ncbi:5'-nucleotidase [Pseudoduganella plicata]|uniref:5'-nucleotidase n=1 Tax=Pseudoduganella plicata TaxID=321984 RepID=A0A4P7BAK2_9BURK|nr:5'-nucleotidase [Pseudoduganella plicata]QBQ35033.1 5'-nucleotidase [Pseudoduganella plicata]GGZ06956.1 5'-nucleotidase [Pseudoduganella plicata]
MPFPIERKLVIGVASSALFDLRESHRVFLDSGEDGYRRYQEEHLDVLLKPGVAFPFIRGFLGINGRFRRRLPVEVVLLSRNSPETGLRVMKSIAHYQLAISRAAFVTGSSPYPYLPAFNAALFLSANDDDVRQALAAGHPAGLVLPAGPQVGDIHGAVEEPGDELRIAFDYDGVIANDEAEAVYKRNNDVNEFHTHETRHVAVPHGPGPFATLFRQLHAMQRIEARFARRQPGYRKLLRVAIVTARNAPSHERVVTTLKSWGVSADETFFLGGMDKARVLAVFKPHIFFDDQRDHLTTPVERVAMVHVPFGIANAPRDVAGPGAATAAPDDAEKPLRL